jgi:hypothetical protein
MIVEFCIVRYRSISSDRHRPMSDMISGSTLALRRAFAPAARRQRAETSLDKNPREGPKKVTACLMAVEILVGVTGSHRPSQRTEASKVSGDAPVSLSCVIIRTIAFTGHRRTSPLHPKPTTSPCTPFFCNVNVSEQKVAQVSWASVAVSRLKD